MAGRIYFIFIAIFILFTNYYQYVTTSNYGLFEYANLLRDVILVIAGLSYFFKKELFRKKYWKYLCGYLVVHLLISFIMQIVPSSYYGDLEDGQIMLNIFTFMLSFVFFLPLYLAAVQLWGSKDKH